MAGSLTMLRRQPSRILSGQRHLMYARGSLLSLNAQILLSLLRMERCRHSQWCCCPKRNWLTPMELLQMPNIRQALVLLLQKSVQGSHQSQQSTPAGGPKKNLIVVHSEANPLPSTRSQSLGGMPSGPPMRPVQATLLQNDVLSGPIYFGLGKPSISGIFPRVSSLANPLSSKTRACVPSTTSDCVNRDAAMVSDGIWAGRMSPNSSTIVGSSNINDSLEQYGRRSKLVKLHDSRGSAFLKYLELTSMEILDFM